MIYKLDIYLDINLDIYLDRYRYMLDVYHIVIIRILKRQEKLRN